MSKGMEIRAVENYLCALLLKDAGCHCHVDSSKGDHSLAEFQPHSPTNHSPATHSLSLSHGHDSKPFQRDHKSSLLSPEWLTYTIDTIDPQRGMIAAKVHPIRWLLLLGNPTRVSQRQGWLDNWKRSPINQRLLIALHPGWNGSIYWKRKVLWRHPASQKMQSTIHWVLVVDIRNSLLNLCPPLSAFGIVPSRIQIWERCGMSEFVKRNTSNFKHFNPWNIIVSHQSHQTIITRPPLRVPQGQRQRLVLASHLQLRCSPQRQVSMLGANQQKSWKMLKVSQVRFRCNRAASWAQRLFSSALPPCPTCSITSVAAPQKKWEVKLTVFPSPIWSHHRTMIFRTSNEHRNS